MGTAQRGNLTRRDFIQASALAAGSVGLVRAAVVPTLIVFGMFMLFR